MCFKLLASLWSKSWCHGEILKKVYYQVYRHWPGWSWKKQTETWHWSHSCFQSLLITPCLSQTSSANSWALGSSPVSVSKPEGRKRRKRFHDNCSCVWKTAVAQLITINFTPKTSQSCPKKWYTRFSRCFFFCCGSLIWEIMREWS